MGAIPDLFNTAKGTSFTPTGVPTTDQLNSIYGTSQNAMNNQQGLANALAGAGGLQNQQNILGQQQGLVGQQQALASQLQGVANGTGPNPAQAMLAQQTAANTANQAALMAGQRGAGANAGLIARQAAQQGAANQQNAIGQGATLQAQQSLGALGQIGGQQQAIGNTLGMMGGTAQQQIANQQASNMALSQAAMNNPVLAMQQQANQIQGGIANQVAGAQGKAVNDLFGGAMSGAASGAGSAMMAEGGQVGMQANLKENYSGSKKSKKIEHMGYADGGNVKGNTMVGMPDMSSSASMPESAPVAGPKSMIGRALKQSNSGGAGAMAGNMLGQGLAELLGRGTSHIDPSSVSANMQTVNKDESASDGTMMAAQGGKVPALLSPGEIYLKPDQAEKVVQGKMSPMDGERIPGKAKIKGDSLKNDVVNKKLDVGGVVVKRTKAQDEESATKFVKAVKSKGKR